GANHDVWVKCGNNEKELTILYSENGGDSWSKVKNSPEEGKIPTGGKICVTADGGTIIYSPENLHSTYYTTDRGETW
ncbi:hypothetical protein ABTK14_24810, partial [Acinetobacter baumannii]